jgi:hypothetical protein
VLTVFAAVVVGGLYGTLFHGFLLGIGSGVLFLVITGLLNYFVEKVDIFYVFRHERLLGKWFHLDC